MYGLNITSGSGATGTANLIINGGTDVRVAAESCQFIVGTTGSSANLRITNNLNGATLVSNCGFKLGNVGQAIWMANAGSGRIKIAGGSMLSGGASPTKLFETQDMADILLDGFDMSNLSSTFNFIAETDSNINLVARNCKLPTSWSGVLNSSTPGPGSTYSLMNSDSADTNYRLRWEVQFGTIVHETTLVKTGGASDGTTPISWDMTTNANAEWSHQTLDSSEIVRWNETVGSSVTLTVDILHDSVTNLQNDEIWLEVQYLGTSGFPLSLFADDAAADYVATPADQTTSGSSWTTTGMTNPNEQELSVTIAPQEKGYFIAKVRMAKASYTVYVDPLLQIS